MALNIKSPEAEQVVRDLARRTGLSITQAVQLAAEEKLRQIDEDRAARRQTCPSARRAPVWCPASSTLRPPMPASPALRLFLWKKAA